MQTAPEKQYEVLTVYDATHKLVDMAFDHIDKRRIFTDTELIRIYQSLRRFLYHINQHVTEQQANVKRMDINMTAIKEAALRGLESSTTEEMREQLYAIFWLAHHTPE